MKMLPPIEGKTLATTIITWHTSKNQFNYINQDSTIFCNKINLNTSITSHPRMLNLLRSEISAYPISQLLYLQARYKYLAAKAEKQSIKSRLSWFVANVGARETAYVPTINLNTIYSHRCSAEESKKFITKAIVSTGSRHAKDNNERIVPNTQLHRSLDSGIWFFCVWC